MPDQRISYIDTDSCTGTMRRNDNRDMDIYRCVFKDDHCIESDHGKSCTGTCVCGSATDHGCVRSCGAEFFKLYEQCEWQLFNKRVCNIDTWDLAWAMWRNCYGELDIYRCL